MVKPKYTFNQYTMTRLSIFPRFNPNNSQEIYYLDNTTGKFNLWKQTIPGSYPMQLTSSNEWAPRGFMLEKDQDFILIAADYQGNELIQLYKLPLSGGIPELLTPNDGKRYNPTPNGYLDKTRLLITTDALGTTMDIAVFDVYKKEIVEQITASDTNIGAGPVSPDKKYSIVSETMSNTIQRFKLLNIQSTELSQITSEEIEAKHFFQDWAPDSSGFYYTSDKDGEFLSGYFYDFSSNASTLVLDPDWDVSQIQISKNGKYMSYVINEGGFGKLYLKDLDSGVVRNNLTKNQGISSIAQFSSDSRYLAFGYTDPTKVSDIHILDLEANAEYVITNNMLGGINHNDMIQPELVTISGFGELDIPAFLYKPHSVADGDKVPILLSIHGGPESQERPSYAYLGLYQILLSLGIGVFAPNIRGSTGYGVTYQKMIHRKWIDIYDDIKSCAEYMKSLDWVDSKRLGVFGGSFGGYATLFAVTRLPEYWKLGVDLVGPSNLITFVKNVPPFWKPMMKGWVGDPIEDEDMLNEASPINYVENIKADMFIGQGANDPRVVKSESDQIVEKLNEMGRHVTYKVWEDEGHGFTKQANFKEFLQLTVEFVYQRFFEEQINLTANEF